MTTVEQSTIDRIIIDSSGLKAEVLSSSLRGFALISGLKAGVFSLGIKEVQNA